MVEGMKRIPKLLSVLLPLFAMPAIMNANVAAAAPFGPDLGVVMTTTGPALVGTPTHIDVVLTNTGNREAFSSIAAIQLPKTATSPGVFVMGTLSNVPSFCQRLDTRLYCSVSQAILRRGGTFAFGFDIALPVSSNPLNFRVDVTANNEQNSANNTITMSAPQSFYTPVVPPAGALTTIRSCSGQNTLSSYFECTVYSGATQTHKAMLVPGGTLDFTANGPNAAGMGGTWTINGSQLTMQYTDGAAVSGNFVGQGSSATCWDGKMTFPTGTYVALYRVCL